MDPVIWEGDPPALRSPVLVCAFAGWNDAASAASTALEAVAASLDPEVTARIDPDEFYDFQVNRPTIRLVEGQTREIDWPANTLMAIEVPTAERDLAELSEPVGRRPPLRCRGAEPEGRTGAPAPPGGADWHRRRGVRARGRDGAI